MMKQARIGDANEKLQRNTDALRLELEQLPTGVGRVEQSVGQPATPWDALLLAAPQRITPCSDDGPSEARPGTKLALLLGELAACGSATTLSIAVRCDLKPRQVWGLLKVPRAIGQVRFEGGRWELVQGFAGRDVERAAALLRDHGWVVKPPNARLTGPQRPAQE